MTRYRWVAARKAEGFPITMACKVAEVSRQAFGDWKAKVAAGPSAAERAEAELVEEIRSIYDEFDGTYGEPRITEELARRGRQTNHKRVERLMRTHGIVGVHKPAKVRTTIPAEDAPPLPDLIGRRFTPGCPDVAWAGDITYIPTGEGWLYLASVLDLGSRRLLGYSMADHMRTELVADALTMAAGARGGATAGIIFHGDRGSQYLSGDYRRLVADLEMRQSVGRTGVCWDNSVAESFWSSLKRELVHRYRFPDRASARRAIFAWINRYNRLRLHSSLGYVPPIEWENHYRRPQVDLAA
ncbi:MAG: IS3 family transposase [Actinobacteria bacterium]|nr:IS3 family transposase [Actinomycetota bacterium]